MNIPFLPSPTATFTFQATLVGTSGNSAAYNFVATWNYYGQRYYLNCYTVQGTLIYCLPMIGSPDEADININGGYFQHVSGVSRVVSEFRDHMSRYYSIQITNSQTGQPIRDSHGMPFGPYASTDDGTATGANLPGALNVEFDLPVLSFDEPSGAGFLKIWGIGLPVMGQASQFNPAKDFSTSCDIKIYGGMSKGLPLANPRQSGLLLDGMIQQAFGNWQGTDQTLDFVILPTGNGTGSFGSEQNPVNIAFDWQPFQQLGDAARKALLVAFPGAVVNDNTSQNLALPYEPQSGTYTTVAAFSQYLNQVSQAIINGAPSGPTNYVLQPPPQGYRGIKIVPTDVGFNLFDGTSQTAPTQIQFTDLIGQPVWLDLATIQFKAVMRADIAVDDYIQMPQGPQIVSAQSNSQLRNQSTFQGKFQVVAVRHMGHFRQRSADSWVTVVTAVTPTS